MTDQSMHYDGLLSLVVGFWLFSLFGWLVWWLVHYWINLLWENSFQFNLVSPKMVLYRHVTLLSLFTVLTSKTSVNSRLLWCVRQFRLNQPKDTGVPHFATVFPVLEFVVTHFGLNSKTRHQMACSS